MANRKHLTLDSRIVIQSSLNSRESLKSIAYKLNVSCSTVSREIKKHFVIDDSFKYGRTPNRCIHRLHCKDTHLCAGCYDKICSRCRSQCSYRCSKYIEEICVKLSKSPYVCNGCSDVKKCNLSKRTYLAYNAQMSYEHLRSTSRSGINLTSDELKELDSFISPLIKQGLSINAIESQFYDYLTRSKSSLYKYIDLCIFDARNIDLPAKVRFRPRKNISVEHKVDKQCRVNRTYADYLTYIADNPDVSIVEMDSVIGTKGGKCILTLHFTNCNFMIAHLRDCNNSKSVTDFFDTLYSTLGEVLFKKLFQVIKTDNGSEFSNPSAIEKYDCKVFYCDPGASHQKGACEKNHVEIRKIYPKGSSFNHLTQEDINCAMSHINSYPRKKLNNMSPLTLFSLLYGAETPNLLHIRNIPFKDIILKPNPIILK